MRVVIQRVTSAQVTVEGEIVGRIDRGLLALVGLADGDGEEQLIWMARKVVGLRIFERDGAMQESVVDISGEILAVSQFTLLGDCRKGKRPSFSEAMSPDRAQPLFDQFVDLLTAEFGGLIQTGRFGTSMQVSLVNDGPVTLILDR